MGNPIFAGAVLAMTMPITMALLLRVRDSVSPLMHIFLVGLPFTAQMTALLFTLSRGPWVGAAAGISTSGARVGLWAILQSLKNRHGPVIDGGIPIEIDFTTLQCREGLPDELDRWG